jgi:hypothetical protein
MEYIHIITIIIESWWKHMAQVIEIPEKDITQKTSKVDDKEVILKLGDYETDKKILELLNKHLEEANDGRSKTKIL